MADVNDAHPAQAAVFCTELHRYIDLLDGQASTDARRLRAHMGLQGAARKPEVIAALQEQLRGFAVERRKLLEMLTAMGHSYPCGHGVVLGPNAGEADPTLTAGE